MPGKGKAKLTPLQLKRALAMRRRCFTYQRIADELGVHMITIAKNLGRIDRKAMARLHDRTVQTKIKQLDQLENLVDEAMQAWERSQKEAREVQKMTGGTGGDRTKVIVRMQAGNPAFLAEMRAGLADIRKILGITATAETDDDQIYADAAERLKQRRSQRPAE